ncbi:GroES-like protein [Trichoderma evansii]
MVPSNRASWLLDKQHPVNAVKTAPYTAASDKEIVIKVKAMAINPADVKIQQMGILITDYPAILGCDVAGEVIEVGPSLADVYNVGDRVISQTKYVVLKSPRIAKIPDDVEYKDAVVLPLGVSTAAGCLFHESNLSFRAPTLNGTKPGNGQTVLVWGGSSSVGSCGVQMLSLAGYEVVAIASKRNHDMIHGLGASICFDQADSTTRDDIVAYLKGRNVIGAFDAISSDSTIETICGILEQAGERKLMSSVRPGAEQLTQNDVKIVTNFSMSPEGYAQLSQSTWKWLEKSMSEKTIKYMPQAEVVGHGLESVQPAVDRLAKGVSAKKLVVII